MIGKNLTNIPFQTFFVSREISSCPLILDIINLGRKIDEFGILEAGPCNISLAYGKRILINARDVNFKDMKQLDIIEIVDYDPIKNIILAIGKKYPNIETPIHWIVQKARQDINAILQITNKRLFERFCSDLPVTEREMPEGTLELAKEILKTLRESKDILIKNKGILLIGFDLNEVEDSLSKILGDFQ